MEFFEFTQNNSGGSFVVDKELCHRLFIEAECEEDAIEKAKNMGVYFNGVEDGRDCGCCGDRWYFPSIVTLPVVWPKSNWCKGYTFNTIEEYAQGLANEYGWTDPDGRIFYADGTIKEINRHAK